MATTNCSEDMLSEILCRLRVKCLKRLQCVCKSWYALIRHPSFVTKHLHFHKNTRSFLLSHYLDQGHLSQLPIDQRKKTYFSLVNFDESTDDIVSIDWVKFSDNSENWYKNINISGSRNGIYCLHEYSREDQVNVIALTNVSTREFKLVPSPEDSISWNIYFRPPDYVETGFDPETNDYKVLILKDCRICKEIERRQAAIYHVSSNSWEELSDPLLASVCPYIFIRFIDTYINGNVHWLAFEGDIKDQCDWYILSFDMVAEVFAKIELPADLRIDYKEMTYLLTVRNESLSLIAFPKTPDDHWHTSYTKCFDIWVMKEYGNDRSWTKELTTAPAENADGLLGLWRNGEFLILHEKGYTISYHPSTQKTEQLCFGEGLHLDKSCIYSESLVSVTRNAPSDSEIVVEDFPFVMTPDMKRNLAYS